ncbi:TraB/GumN family protein [Clostridium sp. 'White wine YQ']|uniref:TraB/GumN family protein n=1 Tax=Clostridium sp. 'White wine YQ' TaxID=3027474 RepID=UPI002366890A|nr:TraB/GumN family protein [Clostridium sp. 'White wine YQ']MDD7794073.1 TraB/GumN family protein [Clostridium sp. 'White wine YQ']
METTKKTYDSINIMRLICAILVITIHTSALFSLGEVPGATLSLVIARIAVPFFFITVGYFFYEKYSQKGYLLKYLKRILIYYLGFSLAYGVILFNFIKQRNNSLELIVKNILFNGISPSLWYLPALILSIGVVAIFLRKNWVKSLIILSVVVYAIGLLGDTYYGLILKSPIEKLVIAYNSIFVKTRNGLCFGVPFITLGVIINKYKLNERIKKAVIFILASSVIFGVEAYLLITNNIPVDNNMYVSLVILVPFIFIGLLNSKLSISERKSKLFRDMSLWVYCIHELLMGIIATLFPKVAGNTIIYFIVVAGMAVTISYFVVRKKSPDYQIYKKKEAFVVFTVLACSIILIAANSSRPSSQGTVGNIAAFEQIDDKATSSNIIGPMWKISKGDEKVYVYGTLGYGTKDMYPLSPKVEDALKQSDGVVVEANTSNLDVNKLAKYVYLEQGDTIYKHVSKEAVDIYKDKTADFEKKTNHKQDFNNLEKVKPEFLAENCISSYIALSKEQVFFSSSDYIIYRANKSKISIIELTDMPKLLEAQTNVPDEVSDASLKLLKYFDEKNVEKISAVIDAWKTGNMDEIMKKENDIFIVPNGEVENYKKLSEIVNRYQELANSKVGKEYAEKIDGFLKDNKNYFVAVSFVYLNGENGMLKQLQDKGYTIEQVK